MSLLRVNIYYFCDLKKQISVVNYSETDFTEKDKARKSHAAFVKHEMEYFDGLDSEICLAYRRFLEKWVPEEMTDHPALKKLPSDLEEAKTAASSDDFIKTYVPAEILDIYCKR